MSLEFRVLGPLEVHGEEGPLPLEKFLGHLELGAAGADLLLQPGQVCIEGLLVAGQVMFGQLAPGLGPVDALALLGDLFRPGADLREPQLGLGFADLGPLPAVSDLSSQAVLEAVRRDKKVVNGKLHYVLATSLGSTATVDDVSEDEIRAALLRLGLSG